MEQYCLLADQKQINDLNYVFEEDFFYSINVEDLESLQNKNVLICNMERDLRLEELMKINHIKEYCYIYEYVKKLNYLNTKCLNRKILLWGAGNIAKRCVQKWKQIYGNLNIYALVDNNCMDGKRDINGIPIVSPERVEDWRNYYIIIAVNNGYKEIEDQIRSYGLICEEDYISWKVALKDCGKMFLKTFYDVPISNNICKRSFEYVNIQGDGVVYGCTEAPGVLPLGNIIEQSLNDLWNSSIAKIRRCSVLNGTYTFCKKEYCEFSDMHKQSCQTIIKNAQYPQIVTGDVPQGVIVGIDRTCNLRCPSCRNEIYIAKGEEKKWLDFLSERVIDELDSRIKKVWFAGNGETFFSETYKNMLLSEAVQSRDQLSILSNGTLFTEENFNQYLSQIKHLEVELSIDGATKDTFEKLRKGALYEKVSENFRFLGVQRLNGRIEKLSVNFVIQADNILELPKMIAWCESNHVDQLNIFGMNNYGLCSDEEFEKRTVFDLNNKIKQEYIYLFTDDIRNHPIVNWVSMHNFVKDKPYKPIF